MAADTWLYVTAERLEGKLAMPVHDDPVHAGRMLTDLLACAAEPLGVPTWWCGPLERS